MMSFLKCLSLKRPRDNWDSVKKYLGTKGFARFLNDMSVGFHDEKTYSELQSRVNDTKLEGDDAYFVINFVVLNTLLISLRRSR